MVAAEGSPLSFFVAKCNFRESRKKSATIAQFWNWAAAACVFFKTMIVVQHARPTTTTICTAKVDVRISSRRIMQKKPLCLLQTSLFPFS